MKKIILLVLLSMMSIIIKAQAPAIQPGDLYMINLSSVPSNSCAFTNAVCWKQMIGATPSVGDPNATPSASYKCFLDIDNLSGKTLTVTVNSAVGSLIITDGALANNPASSFSMPQDLEIRGNNAGTISSTLCIAPSTPFTGNGYLINTSNMGGIISSATAGSIINIPNLRINSTDYNNPFLLTDSLRSFNFSVRAGFLNSNGKNIFINGGTFFVGQTGGATNARVVLDNSIVKINGTLNLLLATVATYTNYSGVNTTINIVDFLNSSRHMISGKITGTNVIENINNLSGKPFSLVYNGVSGNQIPINTIYSNNSFQLECPLVIGFKIGTLQVTKGLVFFQYLSGATTAASRFELGNMILGTGCANNSVLVDGDNGAYLWLTNPITVSNCGLKQVKVFNNTLTCNNCTDLGGNSALVNFVGSPVISDLYWKGSASNSDWDIPSNWCTNVALTTTSSCMPGLNTNVHFLNAPTSNSVVTDGSAYCRNMDWANTSTSYTFKNKNAPGSSYYPGSNSTGHLGEKIYVAGSLNFSTLASNINTTGSKSTFVFCGTGTHSVTSNKTPFNNTVFFFGLGSYTLMDSISISVIVGSEEGTFFINQGTFNSNSKAINANRFLISKPFAKNVNLSNSNIYSNYPGTIGVAVDNVSIDQNITPNTTTYTANNNTTFYLSPKSGTASFFSSNLPNTLLGNVVSNSASDGIICRIRNLSGVSNTPLVFNKVIRKTGDIVFNPGNYISPGNSFIIDSLCYRTTGSIIFSSNSPSYPSYPVLIQSGIGTPNICNKNYKLTGIYGASVITPTLLVASTQNVYNTVIENVVAQGSIANASSSILLGTSNGWTISAPVAKNFYWTGEAPTADWNDWRNWKINSVPIAGAANDAAFNTGMCLPSFSDNVFFHPNSFPLVDSVNIKTNINFNDMNWLSGITGATKKVVSNNTDVNIYGSLILDGMMNNTEFKSNLNFYASDNGNVITSKGAKLYPGLNLYDLKFLGTGTWKITDSLIAQRHTLLHSNGSLDASSSIINKIHLDLFKLNTIGVFTRTLNISGTLVDVDGSNGGAAGTYYSFDINTNGLTYVDNISTYVRVGKTGLSFYSRKVNITGLNPVIYKGTIRFVKNSSYAEIQQSTTAGVSKFHNIIIDNLNCYVGCVASLGTNTDTDMDSLLFSPDGGYNMYVAPGRILTINNHLEASGIYCRTNYIQSKLSGTQTNICTTGGLILKSQYITLKDINSGSCSSFSGNHQAVVNSVDAGNNTGWTFGPTYTPLPGFPANPTLNCSQYPATINTTGFYTTPSSTFLWSNGSTASSLTINQGGTYSLTITYGTNCFYSGATTYSLNNTLTASILKNNVLCPSGTTGTATLSINNQSPITNYSWNLSSASLPSIVNGTNTSVANLTAGNYTLIVNDPNCARTLTFSITQPNAYTITPSTSNIACFGVGTGSAQVIVTGGTPGYTYSWNPSVSSTTNSANGLAAGNYTATIKDLNLCVITQTFIITQPTSSISITALNTKSVSCFGTSTGSAQITPTGGTPGYTYSWTTSPSTTNTATGLIAGNYTATVKDANLCTITRTFVITQPVSAISIASSITSSVACFGASTGSLSVTPTGGTSPYTYSWTTSPSTTNTATGLIAGNYTATVKDANLCAITRIFTIAQPTSSVSIASSITSSVACFGASTGSLSVNIVGGTSPYTYSWAPSISSTTNSAIGLGIGNYTATVRDANLCSITQTFAVAQPTSAISIASSITSSVACFGASTGSLSVTPTSGTSPYTYTWTTSPSTTNTATSLIAGNYTATVKDANLCTITRTFIITQPASAISIASSITRSVACFGANSGSLSVTPTGGTSPYTYSWTPSISSTTNTALNLTTGNYTATIKDANLCVITRTFIITQPTSSISISSSITNSVLCQGANTGSLSVTATGGTPNYTYSWTTSSSTTNTATGLIAGNYTATVKDANLCTITRTFAVAQPTSAISIVSSNTSSVACFGSNTGSLSVTVTGGTAGYTYSWSPVVSSTTNTAVNLTAANYTATIKDANLCTITQSFVITQPTNSLSILSSNTSTVGCFGASTGSLSLTPTGGTSPYTYTWTTSSSTTNTALNLIAGNYTATVRDINLCATTQTFVITQAIQLNSSITATTQAGCGLSNGSATINATGGTPVYTYSWSPPSPALSFTSPVPSATNLAAGITQVITTDANNCNTTTFITISNPNAPVITATQTNVLCYGNATGAASVSITGGTSPYTYSWTPATTSTTNTAINLVADNYIVSVVDNANCAAGYVFGITQPTASLNASALTTSVLCFGNATGSATVTITGGTPNYTVAWQNNSSTTSIANVYTVGSYTYQVTDANQCVTATQTFVIAGPTAALSISASTQTNVSCNTFSNGVVNINTTGGMPSYTYTWLPSSVASTTTTATNLTAGNYTVIVTDVNNCSITQTLVITEPNPLLASITATTIAGCGLANGGATVTTTGGTSGYVYSWVTPITSYTTSSANTTSLSAGVNDVTITDANGCTYSLTTNITNPNAPIVTTTVTNVNCYGQFTGAITTQVTGGTPTYSYTWSNSFTNQNLSNVVAGNYTLTVIDASNCVATQTATITEPTSAIALVINTINDVACFGATTGSVNAIATGGTPAYTYTWSSSNSPFNNTGINNSSITNLSIGNYSLMATDVNGCSTNTVVTIATSGNASLDVTLVTSEVPICEQQNGAISVSVSGGTPNYTYAWNPANNNNATINNLASGTYSVLVTDNNGCKDSLYITLDCKIDLFIPEIFSPNGDGQNELFEIKGIASYPNNNLKIFNRWGSLVYSKDNYNNDWNGRANVADAKGNAMLPAGTYFIVFDFKDGKSKPYNGYVQLEY